MPRSTYYWGIKHSADADPDASVKAEIEKILAVKRHRVYGSRRIVLALKQEGIDVSRSKTRRILRRMGYRASFGKGRHNSYKGEVGKTCPNIIARNFRADNPGEKTGTDVTEFRLPFGKVYLSPVIGFYTRRVVSYSISRRPDLRQSMSRKGNCLDNSTTENFFGLLKKEMFFGHEYEYTDYHSFRKTLEKYIGWYNSERIKLRLHMSPDQYQSASSA